MNACDEIIILSLGVIGLFTHCTYSKCWELLEFNQFYFDLLKFMVFKLLGAPIVHL